MRDSEGSFGLPNYAREDWTAATRYCLTRCEGCLRCRYISVSLEYKECSYHFDCDLDRIERTSPEAFISGAFTPAVQPESLLFLVTAHTPTQRACDQLSLTLNSIRSAHATSMVLVVDNDSPANNVAHVLSRFRNDTAMWPTQRQSPSYIQFGALGIANRLIRGPGGMRAANALLVDAPLTRRMYKRVREVARVVTLQHSTSLVIPMPPPPNARCVATLVFVWVDRHHYMEPFEQRREGAFGLASTILTEGMQIPCDAPCINATTGALLDTKYDWTLAQHSALDMTRAGWDRLNDALWGVPATSGAETDDARDWDPRTDPRVMPQVRSLLYAVDRGSVSRREVNGAMERWMGVVASWLNGWRDDGGTLCNHFSRSGYVAQKVHGDTLGERGVGAANASYVEPRAQRCRAPRASGRGRGADAIGTLR